jgi:hypothetical protein
MVEYALLTGMIALKEIAMTVGNFASGVNWPLVGVFAAAGGLVWWAMKPKGPYR